MIGTSRTYAGVDGGGTKTAFVAVDERGTELARIVTPTSNPAIIGFERSADVLIGGFAELAAAAGTSLPFDGAWIGLSGFDRPGDRERLTPHLAESVREIQLTNDAELVLASLPEGIGIVVIAGTGSISIGRNAVGDKTRAGGWGHIFGDEGSAWGLSVETLRAIACWVDGRGPETSLVEKVMTHWELTDPFGIITRTYDPATTKKDIAQLARLTVQAYAEGDDVAREIVEQQASLLARQVLAVANRLGFTEAIPLAMTGGLLLHGDAYRERLLAIIAEDRPLSVIRRVTDPALSAAQSFIARSEGVHTA